MPTHDLRELWTALRNGLLADATLAAMLGASGEIWERFPNVQVNYPILVLYCQNDNPQPESTSTQLWRPSIEIDIYAPLMSTCDAIKSRLDEWWTIPHNKPAGVASASLFLELFKRRNAMDGGVYQVIETGERIRMLATEWAAKVRPLA